MSRFLFVDAHEDLAWNMLTFGRDYRLATAETRRREAGGATPAAVGDTMLGLPEFRAASTALIGATLFTAPARTREGAWDILTYEDSQQAYEQCLAQVEAYRTLSGKYPADFNLITDRPGLDALLHTWNEKPEDDPAPIGLIILMEGCDGVRQPEEVGFWYEQGVRIFGPAWHATRYSGGTSEPGPLTPEGVELVRMIKETGAILDISHMDELAVHQALDLAGERAIASHSNPKALHQQRKSNRFLSDEVITALAAGGGVIGVVAYNLFLDPSWSKGDPKEAVSIHRWVEQIDYICQLLGDAEHVGIGTDFDGTLGLQSTPAELNSVADVPLLIPHLEKKGYTQGEIEGILGLNWIRYLARHLPA